jgi:hypothetical protein
MSILLSRCGDGGLGMREGGMSEGGVVEMVRQSGES